MMKCVGLMSGTSVDGVDAALIEIEEPAPPKLLCFTTLSIPDDLRSRLFACFVSANAAEICRLNFLLGELFAEAVLDVIRKAGLKPEQVGLIGSHGQTIYHIPPHQGRSGSTLQIAEPSVIAQKTGISTVADFRGADMAVGGQGAPLLPILHHRLFAVPDKNVGVVNIGGISNITYLPGSMKENEVMAFDTGPGNMVIDALAQKLFDSPYDKNGELASRGKTNSFLLEELLQHPYLIRKPPKSTGREEFGIAFTENMVQRANELKLSHSDLLHTATEFTARSIAENCLSFLPDKIDQLWVCGGGVRNCVLMKLLQKAFAPVPVKSSNQCGVDPDALEAMGFAYLAYRTVRGLPGNLPSVTGATNAVVLGKIIPGRNAI